MAKFNVSRRKFIQGTAAVAAAGLASPIAASAATDSLKVRIADYVNLLDPAFWQSGAEQILMHTIFPKLIDFKPGKVWEWELVAAESIEQVDNTHISFRLRPGLMWTGDYGEVTAEDVKYSFERYVNPELESPIIGDWLPLDRVEVSDRYSGVIVFKEPFAPVWWSTLPFTAGTIVCKAAVEEQGGKFTVDPGATAGAYRIEKWVHKQKIVLRAHEGWNGPKPDFEEIVLIPITDPKTAENAFLAEELDVTQVSISSIPVLQGSLPENAILDVRSTPSYTWLGLNLKNPKFADHRVRKAIMMAVDVDQIIEAAYFGVVERSSGLAAPGLLGHRDIAPAKRDVEGARRLMAEAGVDSLTVDLEIQSRTDNKTAAQIIQANLAEIGVNVVINAHDSGGFWSLGDTKGENLELTYKSYTNPPDPYWATQWFLPEQAGIWNWEYFDDAEFEDLHYKALSELDFDKRHAMYARMQEIMDESGGYLFVTHPVAATIYRDSVVPALVSNGLPRFELFKRA